MQNICFFFGLDDFVNVQAEQPEVQEDKAEIDSTLPEDGTIDVDSHNSAAKTPLQTEVNRFLNKTAEEIAAVDSESETNKDPTAESKPTKHRRRCSDLTYLEQWGWHKNRRSTRKKSKEDPAEEADTTINGFLRRILPNYFM